MAGDGDVLRRHAVTPAFIYYMALLEENSHVVGIRNIVRLRDGRPEQRNHKGGHARGRVCDVLKSENRNEKTVLLALVTTFAFSGIILFNFDEI